MNKNCIYTAIIGDYDNLYTPKIVTEGWDYICFTDNKKLKSDFWTIKYVPKKRFSKEKYILMKTVKCSHICILKLILSLQFPKNT